MIHVKEIKPINFIFYRTEITVSELVQVLPIGQQLFKEAVDLNLFITGPVHWHYSGFKDMSLPFTLEIALPVGSIPSAYDGRFHFKRTTPFKCVSIVHEGVWADMPSSYAKIMEYIVTNKLTPMGTHREVYINADFNDTEANTTEIQFGIV